jgi:hypothetical protein
MLTTEQRIFIVISFFRHGGERSPARLSRNAISTNGLEYREQIPTTCVHNFFLKGYLKELVYIQKPFADVLELRQTIENVCDEIPGDRLFEQTMTTASSAF